MGSKITEYCDTSMGQKLCNTCVHHMSEAVQAVEGTQCVSSIVIVGVLTHCALLHSLCDLKVI